jgi:hypothetical protein
MECEICHLVGTAQLFLNYSGEVRYGRIRHYVKLERGKPIFTYHSQSLPYLHVNLVQQNLNVSGESCGVAKRFNGSQANIDHERGNVDLKDPKTSTDLGKMGGCRLAWSRLVDLGSIDSGSNPGSPTKRTRYSF